MGAVALWLRRPSRFSRHMKPKCRGFTLIELMVVVAIVGILAAIALPAYQAHVARTQISEALSLLLALKAPQAEFCSSSGNISSDLEPFGTTTQGKYVASITATPGTPGTGEVTATMKSSGVSSDISGLTVVMSTTDCGKTWDCSGGTVPPRYRPGPC